MVANAVLPAAIRTHRYTRPIGLVHFLLITGTHGRKILIEPPVTRPQMYKHGFSLIELLVVVAIVAILAGIAYPSYTDHVRKARLTDAQMVLMEAAQWMERVYAVGDTPLLANKYPATVSSAFTRSPKSAGNDEDAYYLITRTTRAGRKAGQGYVLTATPRAGQLWRNCTAISIDDLGIREPRNLPECWQ